MSTRRTDRPIAWAVAAVALAAAVAAGVELSGELQVSRIERALVRQTWLIDQGTTPPALAAPADDAPARARLGAALYLARQARLTPDPAASLASARAMAEAAAGARPEWGDAWMVIAFIRSQQTPIAPDAVAEALGRSYRGAPLLRHAADWRVRTGFALWPQLDGETRARVIEETAWLARVDPGLRPALFAAARGTDAHRALLLRWHELRSVDGALWNARQAAPR